jgi:hypothetical protein
MSVSGRRLAKRDVEALMAALDDDPVTALSRALAVVLGRPEGTAWDHLVADAPLSPGRRAALLARDPAALWSLATELNEERTLPEPGGGGPVTPV